MDYYYEYHYNQLYNRGKPTINRCDYRNLFRTSGNGTYEYLDSNLRLIKRLVFNKNILISKKTYNGSVVKLDLGKMYIEYRNKRLYKAVCFLHDHVEVYLEGKYIVHYEPSKIIEEKKAIDDEEEYEKNNLINDELPILRRTHRASAHQLHQLLDDEREI